jgi:trk system potassium uptake protein
MNYKVMMHVCSWILVIEMVCMVPSLLVSVLTFDQRAVIGFLGAMAIAGVLATVLFLLSDHHRINFYAKEGMLVTAFCWILLSVIGSLPYYISGRIPDIVNALFEGFSAMSTTGATILSDAEVLGKGLLFWRSFSQWIGGMGVLLFFLAIIPSSRKGEGYALHLLRAELPGPSVNKMVPRMRDMATVLYKIYVLMTAADIILLLIAGTDVFDAFCIGFSTAGTGGFCVRNTGLEEYTPMAQWITVIFMFLFGINFSLYYLIRQRRLRDAIKGEELRLYMIIIFGSILLITYNLATHNGGTISKILRDASFQVISIISTAGFFTVDYNNWPDFSKAVLIALMFVGACAGSTGGGIKMSRFIILYKAARRNLHNVFHPEEVRTVRIDGERVSEKTIQHVQAYLSLYVFILIISFLLVSMDATSYTITTNFSAVMSSLNNIGPGFDTVGPMSNYAAYNDMSKLVLCVDMLLGRLEIYPILTMLAYSTYKK